MDSMTDTVTFYTSQVEIDITFSPFFSLDHFDTRAMDTPQTLFRIQCSANLNWIVIQSQDPDRRTQSVMLDRTIKWVLHHCLTRQSLDISARALRLGEIETNGHLVDILVNLITGDGGPEGHQSVSLSH